MRLTHTLKQRPEAMTSQKERKEKNKIEESNKERERAASSSLMRLITSPLGFHEILCVPRILSPTIILPLKTKTKAK